MMRNRYFAGPVLGIGAVILWSHCASALTIAVDGGLADWGVAPATHANGNNWTPDSKVTGWWSEDSVGSNGYIGPGRGGQNSDIEAMYAYLTGTQLYIAIATGVDQAGFVAGSRVFKPGDIFLDFGNNGYDTAIGTGGTHAAGSIWQGSGTWWKNPDSDQFPASGPYIADPAHSSQIGSTPLVYTNAVPGNETNTRSLDHNIIETCLTLSANQLNAIFANGLRLHWTLQCGNDLAELYVKPNFAPPPVPEPASLVLLGLGLAGLAARKLRTTKS